METWTLFTIHIILLLLGWLSSTSGTDCPNYCYDIGDGGPLCNKNQECYFCSDGLYGKSCDQPCSVIPNCYHCFNNPKLYCVQCTAGWCSTNCTKACDPRCRTCNILNSTACIDCKPQFYGYNCKEDCSVNCKKSECHDDTGECVDGCDPGFYGPTCKKRCDIISNCLECQHQFDYLTCTRCATDTYGVNCSLVCDTNCVGGCDMSTGDCNGGCKTGFHGNKCDTQCNLTCTDGKCQDGDGECSDGCISGWHGRFCNLPCSGNCKNDFCLQDNGECKGGCVAGFTGIYCTEENEPVDLRTILLIAGAVLVLAFGACVFIACMIYRHRRSQSHNQAHFEDAKNADDDTMISSDFESVEKHDLIIPKDRVNFKEFLPAQGRFGVVKKGIYNEEMVAIKMVKGVTCTKDKENFTKEMKMIHKAAPHNNIVCFYGLCESENNSMCIVMEYCKNGCLLTHLNQMKQNLSVNLPQLVRCALGIAKGMEHLSTRTIPIVHGDLAARNILLNDQLVAKITDYELTNVDKKYLQSDSNDYRWRAPECLREELFTTEGDIWSFGVLLWEIFSLGALPYTYLPDRKRVEDYVNDGHRLERPNYVTEKLYKLMTECWSDSPTRRPTFEAIRKELQIIVQQYGIQDNSLPKSNGKMETTNCLNLNEIEMIKMLQPK